MATTASTKRERYTIRWYEEGDEDAILEMHRAAFSPVSDDWFTWLYEDVPYADDVPIIVADHDGEVVGARPYLPLPISLGETTTVGLMLANLVVHPDHRRQGLFNRMSERTYQYASENEETTFTLTYANEIARRGLAKMRVPGTKGPIELGRFSKAHRFQRFEPFRSSESPALDLGVRAAEPLSRAYFGVLDGRRRRRLRDADVDVVVHHGVPADSLARIAADSRTEGAVGLVRDETFYGWRFADPDAIATTYVAVGDDGPVGALVVTRQTDDEDDYRLTASEVLVDEDATSPDTVRAALLDAVVGDNAEATQISVAADDFPRSVLDQFGFVADTQYPFSRAMERPTFMVRLFNDQGMLDDDQLSWLLSPNRWRFSYALRGLG